MSTSLAVPGIAALQAAAYQTEDFAGVAGSMQSFLPYMSLFTANSGQVKEGKIPLTHYGVTKSKSEPLVDLGKNPVIALLAWRPKAMDTNGDKPLAFYNMKSDEFRKTKHTALHGGQNNGCMFGPEYLCWVASVGYVTFFLGSATARNVSEKFNALLPGVDGRIKTAALGNQFIKTDKFSWHGPTITPSDQSIDMPGEETIEPAVSLFLKPRDSVVEEKAPEGAQEEVTR